MSDIATQEISAPAASTEDADGPSIERDIRNFVATKTGERVYLYLGEKGKVSIRHVRKSGSTILAIFWIKVLQHPNNYPLQRFPYRKLYGAGAKGEDRVVLHVDGVKVAVFMSSGLLQISGAFALEWFVDRFRGVMAAYASPINHPQPLRDVFTEAQKVALAKERSLIMRRYKDVWPEEALKPEVNVVVDGETKTQDIDRKENPRLPDMITDEHVYIHADPDVLAAADLEQQVERLKAGSIVEGHVLHKLWKSLLNLWFSDDACVVYIVTPRLDTERLVSICRLYLNNRLTANLGALCVPMEFGNAKISDVERDAITQFPAKDQVMIEYKVYSNVVYPQKNYQAKFIAGVKDDVASVLLTTADFHGNHFLQSCSDTVVYQQIPETEFMMKYLGPILSTTK